MVTYSKKPFHLLQFVRISVVAYLHAHRQAHNSVKGAPSVFLDRTSSFSHPPRHLRPSHPPAASATGRKAAFFFFAAFSAAFSSLDNGLVILRAETGTELVGAEHRDLVIIVGVWTDADLEEQFVRDSWNTKLILHETQYGLNTIGHLGHRGIELEHVVQHLANSETAQSLLHTAFTTEFMGCNSSVLLGGKNFKSTPRS